MEPTESQYLILNALETLGFLQRRLYDPNTGNWYIQTPSQILPIAMLLQDGEIVPLDWLSES